MSPAAWIRFSVFLWPSWPWHFWKTIEVSYLGECPSTGVWGFLMCRLSLCTIWWGDDWREAKLYLVPFCHTIMWHVILSGPVTEDFHTDHLISMTAGRLLHCTVSWGGAEYAPLVERGRQSKARGPTQSVGFGPGGEGTVYAASWSWMANSKWDEESIHRQDFLDVIPSESHFFG